MRAVPNAAFVRAFTRSTVLHAAAGMMSVGEGASDVR